MKKIILLALVLVLLSTAVFVGFVRPAVAEGTIYIRADGSVEGTDKIQRDGNVYTFTDNIYDSIVVERDNIVIDGAGYTVQGTGSGIGINMTWRSNVTIKNMEIKAFDYGIFLYESSNNIISGNNVTENKLYGIYIGWDCSNNTISGNNVTNNNNGIVLYYSSNNFLQRNLLDGNQYGFGFLGLGLSHFLHSIDSSNLVDGKPVYYLISKHDLSINPSTHPEVGFLGLINSTNITVEGLTMTKNRLGLLIVNTNNTKIQNNNMTNNVRGIVLYYSRNNTISGNNLIMNGGCIWLSDSSGNTIRGNRIKYNHYGVLLEVSSNNTISGNEIAYNEYGVLRDICASNTFYHNNFIDNTQQVYIETSGYSNYWDDGYPSGGNYWSNYTGADSNADGIGDTPHIIDADNQDNYPLMDPINLFNAGTWNEVTYYVQTVSNSTVSDFYFSGDDKLVGFNVNGPEESVGFCRVTIPKTLMWCDALEDWNVTVDGNPPIYLKAMEDANYTYLYFTYSHTIHNVKITSTYVIEEIPPPAEEEVPPPFWMQWWFWTIVIAGIAVLAGAIYFLKKRKPPTPTAPPLPTEGTP